MHNNKPISDLVAVIGMSCRFPGNADSPEKYWELLLNKEDAITDIPGDRWNINAYYDADREALGKMYTKQGGFLDNVDRFDNTFFRISPVEAESLDPQFRMLLELSHEAIENAGLNANKIKGSNTGVFAGVSIVDYIEKDIRSNDADVISAYSVTGTQSSSASGRISFSYGFEGPSITVDTACSSSLTAVQLACKSIQTHESDMAFAAGVNLILSPRYHISFCRLGALSPDCRCKAFDDSANGFVRSEGAGVIILKRYEDALRDGNRILAVIAGTAINNDGNSKGYTVPSATAQEKAIRAGLRSANITADEIDYFEAHGTGTPVGDPIELEGIGNAFKERKNPVKLLVGSAKTNIGHTESAAGIAGLIKILLSMQHDIIPANLHFNTPNTKIDWNGIPVEIPVDSRPWKHADKPRYACINSFGLSGTNVTVVLRDTYGLPQAPVTETRSVVRKSSILPVAASDGNALEALLEKYAVMLEGQQDEALPAIAMAAALHRTDLGCRSALVGSSVAEIRTALKNAVQHKDYVFNNTTAKKIVFVFPGQGSQWLGMSRELYREEKVFRDMLTACDTVISKINGWSLVEELMKDGEQSRMGEVDVIQPMLFSVEIALAKLWQSWGVQPDVLLGHSMGESAAAYIAGALSLEDAAAVICKRSRLAKKVSGRGAMLLTELTMEEAEERIISYSRAVSVAAANGPKSTVLSGDIEIITLLQEQLTAAGIFNRLIRVDFASHSPHMDLIKDELEEMLKDVSPVKGTIPVFSSVDNVRTDGSNFDARYWSGNLRKPVLFSQAVQQLLEEDEYIFIEVSPHPILVQLIQQNIEHLKKSSAVAIHSLKREEPEQQTLMNSLAYIYANGAGICWEDFYNNQAATYLELPAYPWQRERFWLESSRPANSYTGGGLYGHPMLGRKLRLAGDENTVSWNMEIDTVRFPYLNDHIVRGTVILPGAAYVEILLATAVETYGDGAHYVSSVSFLQPMVVSEKPERIQVVLKKELENVISAGIYSGEDDWTLHCSAVLRLFRQEQEETGDDSIPSSCHTITGESYYQAMKTAGIIYGERFRLIQHISVSEGMTTAHLLPGQNVLNNAAMYHIHPAILDSCFQACLASLSDGSTLSTDTYLPAGIGELYLQQDAVFDGPLKVVVTPVATTGKDTFTRNINVYNEIGKRLIRINNFSFTRLDDEENTSIQQCLYELKWKQLGKPVTASVEDNQVWLIVAGNEADAEPYIQQLVNTKRKYVVSAPSADSLDKAFTTGGITQAIFPGQPRGTVPGQLSPRHETTSLQFIHFLQYLQSKQLSPRVHVITSGSQQVTGAKGETDPFQSPLWGVARVAFHEYPELEVGRIDIHPAMSDEEWRTLFNMLQNGNGYREYAIRNDNIYIPELQPVQAVETSGPANARTIRPSADTSFRFVTDEPGLLDNITVREYPRLPIREDEIEVQVQAVGLNFLNVMSALGIYPGYPRGFLCLGIEFTGVVLAAGAAVTDLKPGDRVMGLSPVNDCMGKYVVCKSLQAVLVPEWMDITTAASFPVAYGTAYATMVINGNLQKGERVLIHAATGGVGLSAIKIAQQIGAEIYATAGSEHKRALLREMGIKHVMDSRSTKFAAQIRELTNNEGIDMVLNSLTGEAMVESMRLLRGFGRFLEIGKKDIYEKSKLGMEIFRESISYTFFDFNKMSVERPAMVRKYFSEALAFFAQGDRQPVPATVFPASRIWDGFNLMARSEHTGKIVIDMQDPALMIGKSRHLFHEEETYLVTGGMGGLGLEMVTWMCAQGARNLVLTGRHQPVTATRERIDTLRLAGYNIVIKTADVSDYTQLAQLLSAIRDEMPPLKGVFHAAGLLNDMSVQKMDDERFYSPLLPKMNGAWHLHLLTQQDALRYFVVFSSAASVLGSPGQANYVAGNSFLDTLTRYRTAQQLPATCINWGPVAGVGLAAATANRGERLDNEGIRSFSVEEYLAILENTLRNERKETVCMKFNYARWIEHNPTYSAYHLLSPLNTVSARQDHQQNDSFITRLKEAASYEAALLMLEKELREIMAAILKTNPAKIDAEMPFVNLGLDSLMAIQLRNRLEKLTGKRFSITTFWSYPRIRLLTGFLAEDLALQEWFGSKQPPQEELEKESIEQQVDQMSVEEVFAELDKELDDIL